MSTQWPEDNDQSLQLPESLPKITTNAHPCEFEGATPTPSSGADRVDLFRLSPLA